MNGEEIWEALREDYESMIRLGIYEDVLQLYRVDCLPILFEMYYGNEAIRNRVFSECLLRAWLHKGRNDKQSLKALEKVLVFAEAQIEEHEYFQKWADSLVGWIDEIRETRNRYVPLEKYIKEIAPSAIKKSLVYFDQRRKAWEEAYGMLLIVNTLNQARREANQPILRPDCVALPFALRKSKFEGRGSPKVFTSSDVAVSSDQFSESVKLGCRLALTHATEDWDDESTSDDYRIDVVLTTIEEDVFKKRDESKSCGGVGGYSFGLPAYLAYRRFFEEEHNTTYRFPCALEFGATGSLDEGGRLGDVDGLDSKYNYLFQLGIGNNRHLGVNPNRDELIDSHYFEKGDPVKEVWIRYLGFSNNIKTDNKFHWFSNKKLQLINLSGVAALVVLVTLVLLIMTLGGDGRGHASADSLSGQHNGVPFVPTWDVFQTLEEAYSHAELSSNDFRAYVYIICEGRYDDQVLYWKRELDASFEPLTKVPAGHVALVALPGDETVFEFAYGIKSTSNPDKRKLVRGSSGKVSEIRLQESRFFR